MAKSASPSEGFERAFDLVGGHGIFQWRLMAISSIQLIILTWHHIGYSFLGAVPNHWCSIPELKETNWTLDQIKLISIPRVENNYNASLNQSNFSNLHYSPDSFKKCEYFKLDYEYLLQLSNYNFEVAYSTVDWGSVSTEGCQKWDYDTSIYKSTVATEFDLVCANRWMAATIQGSYMTGGLIGTLIMGTLSDRFLGRRKTILTALTLVIFGGILASFSVSYWMFLFLRMIIAIGVAGTGQICFVLLTEHSDKDHRALLGIVLQVAFAVGYMILPGMAYYLREWNHLQLSFGVVSCVLVVYFWILPDSPRWLATHGHTESAVRALNNIAKVNRLPRPNRADLEEIVRQCHNTGENKSEGESEAKDLSLGQRILKGLKSIGNGFKNLMRTAEMRKRSFVFWTLFISVMMVYYGMIFSSNLTSDPYLLVFLGGLMEIPAYTVIVPFVSRLGRRPTTAGTFILTGICMLALSATPNPYEIVRLVLAMAAKLFISAGFAIVYLLGAELYPTELRTTGLAVGVIMGRVGAITAPYIVDLLQLVYRDLPTLIFGTIAILAGLAALLLPETRTMEMSDKVVEIELHAEEEKAKERERRMSWVVGED